MASGGIPDEVRALIAEHIGSVLELEVLLAMRGQATPCSPEHLAREMRLNDAATATALQKFAAVGLLLSRDGDFAFEPRTNRLAKATDALADAYARRRVRVIELIYKGPSESVSAFADAFKLRRDD